MRFADDPAKIIGLFFLVIMEFIRSVIIGLIHFKTVASISLIDRMDM